MPYLVLKTINDVGLIAVNLWLVKYIILILTDYVDHPQRKKKIQLQRRHCPDPTKRPFPKETQYQPHHSRLPYSRLKRTCDQVILTQGSQQKNVNFPIFSEELEAINRKIVEDTTEQFKNLELDVQRVEKILEEKELQITSLETGKKLLEESLDQANEEKKILIEAIFEKDLVIKEF